ncbi:MAG: glycosyltransferase [Gammaproteobacteria bacterium]|nr:glycosyltransferase [Gammaproteobacteria bacterium]
MSFDRLFRRVTASLKVPRARRGESISLCDDFDAAFYLAQNPDVAAAGLDPLLHYLRYGEAEGRRPTPEFDPRWYLEQNPELKDSGHSLFWHYLNRGWDEERSAQNPNALSPARIFELGPQAEVIRSAFDSAYYLAENPDVTDAGVDPVLHYLEYGEAEGRRPTPEFDPVYYRQHNPDLKGGAFSIFWHYVQHGAAENRAPHDPAQLTEVDLAAVAGPDAESIRSAFDAAFYLAQNPDVAAAGLDPLLHYLATGETEGRRPVPEFDPAYYRQHNPDLAAAEFNLFWHYVHHGKDETRQSQNPNALTPQLIAELEPLAQAIRGAFDSVYYLAQNPEVAATGVDPVLHYLAFGEADGCQPTPDFDPEFYLQTNPDLARAGIRPFSHYIAHGRAERRSGLQYFKRPVGADPLVSVIVPNYNHARFLDQRLQSIFDQGYQNLEIIVLDDKSPDNSIEVIEALKAQNASQDSPREFRTHYNEINAGNVFAQWQTGINKARGELIWICESDDFCAPDFLQTLVPHFRDKSVQIAFGNIQFCDDDGKPMPGMGAYRESAEPGIWDRVTKRPAKRWFDGALGAKNVISNVGGCVFRKQKLSREVWEQARRFKIAGDWYLYSEIAGGGQIVYDPAPVAYFRQHGANTSASNFHQPYYYLEHAMILRHLIDMWGLSTAGRQRLIDKIAHEYKHHRMDERGHDFDDLIPVDELMGLEKTRRHIQLAFLGFYSGGGEVFPISLANVLVEAGYLVSLAALNLDDIQPEMFAALDSRVAVYDMSSAALQGRAEYLAATGVDLIHSHIASCDHFFFKLSQDHIEVPYVVTLHGSHDTIDTQDRNASAFLDMSLKNVAAWVYTADKNLRPFKGRRLPKKHVHKINNAMLRDTRDFPQSRADLGVADNAVVFSFVARGIERKGWRAVVMAFQALMESHPARPLHLLLVGDGEKADVATRMIRDGDPISWLGYQSHINGLYRLSDVALIPTRFAGESNPLCLIQAAQEHLPIIATDIGEIRNMLSWQDDICGIVLDNKRNTREFADDLSAAMVRMLNQNTRKKFARRAGMLAEKFSVERMLEEYQAVYDSVWNDPALAGSETPGATPVRHKTKARHG